jgi:hypothetical protein
VRRGGAVINDDRVAHPDAHTERVRHAHHGHGLDVAG